MKSKYDLLANNGPMLNAYPDSIGESLKDIVWFLQKPELKDVFSSLYLLPSIFNTDLDRGFSVIDYSLNKTFASTDDLKALEELKIDLKLDFILNHASVLSKQFQDILKNGKDSEYIDFFIDWNKFWDGHGKMTEEGYIQPKPELIENMFFRKQGLPILMVRMPDGSNVPYWNTFYQEIQYPKIDAQDIMKIVDIQYTAANRLANIINEAINDGTKISKISFGIYEGYKKEICEYLESKRKYLGQMDININSPLVWDFYEDTIRTLSKYGAKIVRLDAFAYAPKEVGRKNFLNEPGTWDLLEKIKIIADRYDLELLPEIHASYEEKIYDKIAKKGYLTYDFYLPGLIIDALENKNGYTLAAWAKELQENDIRVVNMLGCHDGIPLLDLKGMIPDEKIEILMNTVVERNGYVKNLHGQKNVYYQVNATYYSALGENNKKMLLARALQIFMPGKPQVWYLDLFLGKNDIDGMIKAGANGHKEINRTNVSKELVEEKLKVDAVKKQLEMIKFRSTFPAFAFDSNLEVNSTDGNIEFTWVKNGFSAYLKVDFLTVTLEMYGKDEKNNIIFSMDV